MNLRAVAATEEERSRASSGDLLALAALVALAAGLRFAGLHAQSWWYDEAVTRQVVGGSLGHVFDSLPKSESTPPLYYVALWLWRHVFGLDEAGIRSFSALCGTAVVPVVWAAGRRMGSTRLAFVAASVVAVVPTLVWYSQEARAYSLLTLLGALSFLALLAALDNPSWRSVGLWSLTCILALLTHYFAAFVVAAEGAALLWSHPGSRRVWTACAACGAAGLALLPLALSQEADGRTAWIEGEAMTDRLGDVVRELVSAGNWPVLTAQPSPHGPGWPLAALAVVGGLFAAVTLPSGRIRKGARLALIVGSCGILIPLAFGLVGVDYFYDRNLLAAWPALCLALAAGLSSPALGRLWPVPLAALAVVSIGTSTAVALDANRQRDDWRGLVNAVGTTRVPRAIVLRPRFASPALEVYGLPVQPASPGTGVRELLLLGEGVEPSKAPASIGDFRLVERRRVQRLGLLRYRGERLERLTSASLAQGDGSILYQAGDAAREWYGRAFPAFAVWQEAASRPLDEGLARRLRQTVREPERLVRVPAEIPNAAALEAPLSHAVDAVIAYGARPTASGRARIAEALQTIRDTGK